MQTEDLQDLADAVFAKWCTMSPGPASTKFLTILDRLDEELSSRDQPLLNDVAIYDPTTDDRYDYPYDV